MRILLLALFAIAFIGCDKPKNAPVKKEIIGNAPKGLPFSPAVKVGNTIYVSGHIGFDPKTKKIISDSIEEQTRQTLKRIGATLKLAGCDYSDVVSATVYLTDLKEFPAMNKVYKEFFVKDPPARATVGVADLVLKAKVEISVIAHKSK